MNCVDKNLVEFLSCVHLHLCSEEVNEISKDQMIYYKERIEIVEPVREAAKQSNFFSGRTTKRGGLGGKGRTTQEK